MQPARDWTVTEKFLFRFCFLFVLLFLCSFSFPHEILPDVGHYPSLLFEKMAAWTGRTFFHTGNDAIYALVSDSTGFYLHALDLFVLSLLVAAIWSGLDRQRKNYSVLFYWFSVIVRYYLAMQLLSYGLNKVFKWQFYFPEPNILYTRVGEMHRDILYWTSMGTSRTYSVFSGMAEVIAALLLLFRRTKMAGALFALGIMINVLMINLGFDITVKLYSCFLIFLCLILLAPDAKRLWKFFFANEAAVSAAWQPDFRSEKRKRLFYTGAKTFVILLLLTDASWLYVRTGNYNDDAAARPPLHGAYAVATFVKNSDTLSSEDPRRWKRAFVHRNGYFIVQFPNESMQDYYFGVDTMSRKMILQQTDDNVKSALNYSVNGDLLHVRGTLNADTLDLLLRKLDLKSLPLMQDEFSWTY